MEKETNNQNHNNLLAGAIKQTKDFKISFNNMKNGSSNKTSSNQRINNISSSLIRNNNTNNNYSQNFHPNQNKNRKISGGKFFI